MTVTFKVTENDNDIIDNDEEFNGIVMTDIDNDIEKHRQQ